MGSWDNRSGGPLIPLAGGHGWPPRPAIAASKSRDGGDELLEAHATNKKATRRSPFCCVR